MKKRIIALSLAAMSSCAVAESNVTVYGNIDVGVVYQNGKNGAVASGKSRRDLSSAGSESYIGFKGVENIGNGLKAVFDLQYRFQPDNGGGLTQAGRKYVGLAGDFGTVVVGYLDGLRYGIYGKYNPFGNYSIGNFASMTTQYDRAQNALAYISPNFGGFTLILATATNTQGAEGSLNGVHTVGGVPSTGNNGDDRLFSANLIYANGPLSVDLDYETTTAVGYSDSRLYVLTTGASYDFGPVKVGAVYDIIKGDPNSLIGGNIDLGGFNLGGLGADQSYDRRNWFVGVTVPVGNFSVLASYGQVKDRTLNNADADKWAVGVRYSMSKRTQLYADYAQIDNDSNAAYTINAMGNSLGLSGTGVKGFAMGIKHSF